MNLFFAGHQEKYAVEQTLLTLFPQERPVYPDTPPGGDNELVLSFSRGSQWCTARAVLRRGGKTYVRQCRVAAAELPAEDPVVSTRLTRRTLQRAFYLAAVDCLGTEPPWGMLSGVRPVKLPTRAMEAGASPRQAEKVLRDTYRVSPGRRKLAMDCAQASLAVKRDLKPQEISLYVGIPFCPTRCAYCSFISASGSANRLIPDYLDALLAEIDAAGAAARRAGKTVRSVYLGGGCGFLSKTEVYPMFGDREGVKNTQEIFRRTLGKQYRQHKHDLDAKRNVSPHVYKLTYYRDQAYEMGKCLISIE